MSAGGLRGEAGAGYPDGGEFTSWVQILTGRKPESPFPVDKSYFPAPHSGGQWQSKLPPPPLSDVPPALTVPVASLRGPGATASAPSPSCPGTANARQTLPPERAGHRVSLVGEGTTCCALGPKTGRSLPGGKV